MKKLFLFTALALFCLTFSFAQVNFGAKAGVNFSDITGDDVDSFTGRTAFHVGVVAEIMVSDIFAVQPEILYSAQGSDWEEEFEGETFEGEGPIDYLNIPIMAKYYVGEGGFSVEAGPQVGILLSAEYTEDDLSIDIKDDLKGIDFGVNFGLGYKMESGLNFAARYNLGLTDANDNPDELGDSDFKNSVIQVSVGYFF
ncbi:MAG: PorT family protein [Flavobacteriaceae bacterium]|nr:PorT family protein [Flavobacteriaceae bacterium]